MHMPGFWSMMIILAVVLILFGGKKLPELGSALGESIKNFKKGIKDEEEEKRVADQKNSDQKHT